MKYFLGLIFLMSGFLSSQETDELSVKQRNSLIQEYYNKAIVSYHKKDYSSAIQFWEEILKLDASQSQVRKLISDAKEKQKEKDSEVLKQIAKDYNSGDYISSYNKAEKLSAHDPKNTELNFLVKRLSVLKNIFGYEKGDTKASKLIRNSAKYFIEDDPAGIKTLINSVIYAGQLEPKNEKIKEYMKVIEKEYPKQVKSVEVISGINLVEQKLQQALNYIYDAKYDRAIFECNEVLELEPDNSLALKRLGSAYYAMNKPEKAKEIWKKAYKLNPKDEELKEFLSE